MTAVNPLSDLIHRATAASAEEKRLKEARKRLQVVAGSNHPAAPGEAQRLLGEIRKLEEGRVWVTHERVALFFVQECACCGTRHEFFRGWMLGQSHVTDRTAHKLAIEPSGPRAMLPERREDHYHGLVETCANCVESVMAINAATGQSVPQS